MKDFIKEGVKVGDRLYSTLKGWCKVSEIIIHDYPIRVEYELGGSDNFTSCGKGYNIEKAPQMLFWDEPKFEVPAKPKREVVKEIDVFVNYYPRRIEQTEAFQDESEADTACDMLSSKRYKGKLIFTILE